MPRPNLLDWTGTAANANGQFTAESLGNGLITTRIYDNVTGRLSIINTSKRSPESRMDNGFGPRPVASLGLPIHADVFHDFRDFPRT